MPNEIRLYGSVGASWWEEDYFTAATVQQSLADMSGDITVHINSGGGIASEGQAIYTMLKDHPGQVHVVIDAVAASAASLIAMAGDTITLRTGAWMLIHDPAQYGTIGRGTEQDHLQVARQLKVIAGAYADVYAQRAGMSRDEARQIMKDETVLDGAMALALGLATAVEDTQAVALAPFDYAIYAHAPQVALDVAKSLPNRQAKQAVMAAIAGFPGTTHMEPEMPPETQTTVTAAQTQSTPPVPDLDAATIRAEAATRSRRILEAVTMTGVDVTLAADLIGQDISLDAALDRISAAWKAKGGDDRPSQPAIVLQDETQTRMDGMEEALAAKLGPREARLGEVSANAKRFMDFSLTEMAAHRLGQSRAPRDFGAREEMVRMAFHTTSDFSVLFENALNRSLRARYNQAEPTYRRIASQRSYSDFRAHISVRAGDFPQLQAVNPEGGEIKGGTFSESKESTAVNAYGVQVRFSRRMLVDDNLSALQQVLNTRGNAVARFEDDTFYAMMISGTSSNGPTLNETARQVFNTTDKTLASTAAAITVASLGLGRAAIRKHTSMDGAVLNIRPSILLVGPDKETEAQTILAPIQAAQASNVNPFSGTLDLVVTGAITGNAWYLFADPGSVPCFEWGLLEGYTAPRFRMEDPFGVQGMAVSLEHDFGCGAIDFRGGYRNAGA